MHTSVYISFDLQTVIYQNFCVRLLKKIRFTYTHLRISDSAASLTIQRGLRVQHRCVDFQGPIQACTCITHVNVLHMHHLIRHMIKMYHFNIAN